MDIIGIWNVAQAMTFDEDLNNVWRTKDDVMADESADDDLKELFDAKIAFCEDGFVRSLYAIPEDMSQEEIDEMVGSGEAELYGDGYMSMERRPWKVEDGKILVDTGMKAEVLGEEVSSWTEVKVLDGLVEYMMFRLARD